MHKNTKGLCLSNCGKLLSGFILNTVCKSCHWSQSLKPRLVCYYFELDTHRLGFLFVTSLKYDRQSLIEVYKISKLHRSPGLYCIMTAVLLFFFFSLMFSIPSIFSKWSTLLFEWNICSVHMVQIPQHVTFEFVILCLCQVNAVNPSSRTNLNLCGTQDVYMQVRNGNKFTWADWSEASAMVIYNFRIELYGSF